MFGYVVHRLLVMIPTLLAISAITFLIMQLPPGDFLSTHIAELQSQGESVDMAKIEFLRQQYGLDHSPVVQYFHWIFGMLHGDFGYSFEFQLPVTKVVGDKMWLTVIVSVATILFTWIVSFPIASVP